LSDDGDTATLIKDLNVKTLSIVIKDSAKIKIIWPEGLKHNIDYKINFQSIIMMQLVHEKGMTENV